MHPTPDELLETHLPRSLRGFDEGATADLIERAAAALKAALAQRDALQAKLNELRGQAEVHPGRVDSDDVEKMGAALLTAHRLAERLLAETREEIERLDEEAAQQRRAMLEAAQKEIVSSRTEAAIRVEDARAEEARLRGAIDRHKRELAKLVRDALDHLTNLGELAPPAASLDVELQERLAQTENGEVARSSDQSASQLERPSV